MKKLLLLSYLLLHAALPLAQEQTSLVDTQEEAEPSLIPPQVKSGEVLEPEVTIIKEEGREVREYRANGQLYMIEVKPVKGVTYYLIDTTGDGRFDTRRDQGLGPNMVIPGWVLMRW